MRNSNDTMGNLTRDLPICSAVPQLTAPPRASYTSTTVLLLLFLLFSLSLHPLTLHSLLNPDLFQDQFPGVSIPSYSLPTSNNHFLHIILTLSNHLILGFQTDHIPSGLFLNIFFTVLSFGVLTSLISEIISVSLYHVRLLTF
jgi:hypothetical protein